MKGVQLVPHRLDNKNSAGDFFNQLNKGTKMDCIVCDKELTGNQRKFCSTKCCNKDYSSRMVGEETLCEYCGELFRPASITYAAKTCSKRCAKKLGALNGPRKYKKLQTVVAGGGFPGGRGKKNEFDRLAFCNRTGVLCAAYDDCLDNAAVMRQPKFPCQSGPDLYRKPSSHIDGWFVPESLTKEAWDNA